MTTLLLDTMPIWRLSSAQLRTDASALSRNGDNPQGYRGNLLTTDVPHIEMLYVQRQTAQESLAIFDWSGERRVMSFVESPQDALRKYFGPDTTIE